MHSSLIEMREQQYNTIKAFIMCAWSAGGPNLRHGSHKGERWRGAGLREGTGKIIRLKVSLKRGKRRAIANFDREFITIRDAILTCARKPT